MEQKFAGKERGKPWERQGIRAHTVPFVCHPWSLCISPRSVYNNNDKDESKEAYDGFCEAGTGISEGM